MHISLNLLLHAALTSVLFIHVSWSCDIASIRESANARDGPTTVGGWSGVAVDDSSVVQLKQTVVNDANSVSKAHHVIESYQQVVNGVNYCIRFSATANCSHHHCQSVECVAGGHQPLPSASGVEQPVQRNSLTCTPIHSCNIDRARELAKTPMPGGWYKEKEDSDVVQQLYDNALTAADVRQGDIVEAYGQTVAGFNYCILFHSTGSANCQRECQALSCVAGGFLPLEHETNNPGVVSKVGVTCLPGGNLRGYAGMPNGSTTSSAIASLMTSFFVLILASIFG